MSYTPTPSKFFFSVNPQTIHVVEGFNPRVDFETGMDALVDSIKRNGVLVPLVCQETDDGFELIDGERRFRAIQILGYDHDHVVTSVPVKLVDVSEMEALGLALNIGSSDGGAVPLTVLEEAEAVGRLKGKQEDIATGLGKSQPWVSSRVKIDKASDEIKDAWTKGRITTSVLIELAREKSANQEKALAETLGKSPKNGKKVGKGSGRPTAKAILEFLTRLTGLDNPQVETARVILGWACGEEGFDEKKALAHFGLKPAPKPKKKAKKGKAKANGKKTAKGAKTAAQGTSTPPKAPSKPAPAATA